MKKVNVTIVILTFGIISFGQTSDLKAKFEAVLRKTDPSYKVYINKAGGYLEIDHTVPDGSKVGIQFPYMIVKFMYKNISDEEHNKYNGKMHVVSNNSDYYIDNESKPIEHLKYHDYVKMSCPNGSQCFLNTDGSKTDLSDVSQAFKSKDDAYKFLDLIDQLKKQ